MTVTAPAGLDPGELLPDGRHLIGPDWVPAASGETIARGRGFGSRGVIGAPWGGYKHSGFGRTMSAESILDYTQVKTVVINA